MKISAEDCLSQLSDLPLLDVRSPAEYAGGHIPGALSLPLFTDQERAEVGTLYKQQGPQQAFLRGLELAGSKLRWYAEEGQRLAPQGRLMLHCWRGGQRSASLGWLLLQAGFEVKLLQGGYKAYRQQLLADLSAPRNPMLILGGYTGSGKTLILQQLAARGASVIDLEKLAHHKGSAFGALGEQPQPTVEQFENDLHYAWRSLSFAQTTWLEDESRSIGRVYLPDPFWRQMLRSPLIFLDLPLECRIEQLVKLYAPYGQQQLQDSFERIAKRLGGQHVKAALEALEKDDFAAAAAIALQYYDKAYLHSLRHRDASTIRKVSLPTADPAEIAAILQDMKLDA
jgi:tRNA 2-selenouridine synthase